jgi:hypothetical protein
LSALFLLDERDVRVQFLPKVSSMRDRRTTFQRRRSGDMVVSYANRKALATASVSATQRRSSSSS